MQLLKRIKNLFKSRRIIKTHNGTDEDFEKFIEDIHKISDAHMKQLAKKIANYFVMSCPSDKENNVRVIIEHDIIESGTEMRAMIADSTSDLFEKLTKANDKQNNTEISEHGTGDADQD